MIVIGSLTGAFLLVSYFKRISANFIKEGLYVGVTWFIINNLLDILILIPMSGMSLTEYFFGIGLRYLVMPVMSIMLGAGLSNKEVVTNHLTIE